MSRFDRPTDATRDNDLFVVSRTDGVVSLR